MFFTRFRNLACRTYLLRRQKESSSRQTPLHIIRMKIKQPPMLDSEGATLTRGETQNNSRFAAGADFVSLS